MGRGLPRTTLVMGHAVETVVYPPSDATAGRRLVAHPRQAAVLPELPPVAQDTCSARADDAWAYAVWLGDEGAMHTALVTPARPPRFAVRDTAGRIAFLLRWVEGTAGPDRWLGSDPVRAFAVTAGPGRDSFRGPAVETGAGGLSSTDAVTVALEDLRRREDVRGVSPRGGTGARAVVALVAVALSAWVWWGLSRGWAVLDVLPGLAGFAGVLTGSVVRRTRFARRYRPEVVLDGR